MYFKPFVAIAALTLALAPQAAVAEGKGWTKVSESEKAQGVYVDSERVEKSGPTIKYWVKTVMWPDNSNRWDHYEVQYEGDCAKKLTKILRYSVTYQTGKVEDGEGDDTWDDVLPDSVADDHLSFACAAAGLTKS